MASTKEDLALTTFVKLVRATQSVSRNIHRHLTEIKLTDSQFAVLEALHHLGPLCQKDIAKKILKTNGNVTILLNKLEHRNLVIRVPNKKDRRYFSVELTEEGRALISYLFPRHAMIINESFSALTGKEQDELARLCKKLGLHNCSRTAP